MAGVKICTDFGAYCLAKSEKALCVINAETGVKLKGNFVNAVSLCKGNKVLPIRNEYIVPLIFKYLAEIVGPGACNPVGILRAVVVTGAA